MSPSPDHERRHDPSLQAPAYVRNLAPYIPGKPIADLAREFGLAEPDIVKLASNENPRGPSAAVRAAILRAVDELCRYPDGNGFALKAALAERHGVDPDRIVLGNGSNDVLELVTQAFLRPGDQAVYSRHAFAVYPLAVQARGATGIEVPARDFGHDLPAMRAAITPATRIVFVANPNNPTGTWIAPEVLEAFIASIPEDVLVVLDAAYDEYLEPAQQAPSAAWTGTYPNLIVSRTFSKAYGLAALRVGYGIMHAHVADMLNRVRQPFNVNALAQAAAAPRSPTPPMSRKAERSTGRACARSRLARSALGLEFIPSHGNFLLVRVGEAERVLPAVARAGRDRASGRELRAAGVPAGHRRPSRGESPLSRRAAIGARAADAQDCPPP